MKSGTVLLISDIHTHYDVINVQVRHAMECCGHAIAQVLVLGDFGFFKAELHDYFRRRGKRFLVPVACIEGNHEDHAALAVLANRYADVVTHLPRGSVHRLGNWRSLCLGGARYMDALSTPRGCEITDADVAACLSHAPDAVDFVASHDCPAGIGVPGAPGLEYYGTPGEPRLARVAEHFSPRWWFFGHHHRWFDLSQEGTRYIGLPESWVGYALLAADGDIVMVPHAVALETRSRWKSWLGLR